MKAVVKTTADKGNVELKDVEVPQIGPEEVLIQSKAAPIGSDVRVYDSDPVMMRVTRPPVIIGSENSGEIVEIGNEVVEWRVGDRVVCELVIDSCGHCNLCKLGRPFMCPEVVCLGRGRDGSFADYFIAPVKYLHRIPDNVTFEDAAMAEDLGVVITAVDDHQAIKLGDTVAILGPGPIGLLSLQVAKACGAGPVVVSGTRADAKRLKLAEQLGADYIVDIEKKDPNTLIHDLTNSQGADVVIIANSATAAIHQGFQILKKYGTLVALGYPPGSAEVPWYEITANAMKIVGGWGASSWSAWEKALKCIAHGSVKVTPMVTHKFPLDDWEKAFEIFRSCQGLKVQLIP